MLLYNALLYYSFFITSFKFERKLCFQNKLFAVLGNSEDVVVPTLVGGLKGHHVVDVACGSGDAQTLAVTKDGKSLVSYA